MGLRTGPITFGGLSSGIPTSDIIDQLVAIQRRPIDLLEQRKSDFETRLSIFQDLNSKTRALHDALRDLDNMNFLGTDASALEEFARYSATSSDETKVAATTTGVATPGSINLEVTSLAQSEREVSQGFTALTDTVDDGSGTHTFQITVGGASDTITVDSTNNTVEGLISAINDLGLDVTAFALNDGSASPYRIAIQGTKTGDAQEITITHDLAGGAQTPAFVETQDAADASITIDPGANAITVTSTTNSFANVIAGLTFTAKDTTTSPVTVTVGEDATLMTEAVQGIVSLYNDIISTVDEQFEVDAATNRGGPLIGDSTLASLKQRLAGALTSQFGTGTITNSSQIGLSLDRNGVLTLDEQVFQTQLAADFEGVGSFFTGAGSLADQLRSTASAFTDTIDGSLVARINGTTSSIQDLEDSITRGEDRLVTIEENLVRQFAALERTVSGLQQQGNFLSQFLLTSLSSGR